MNRLFIVILVSISLSLKLGSCGPIVKDDIDLDERMSRFEEQLKRARQSMNDLMNQQKSTTEKVYVEHREIPETTETNVMSVKKNLTRESWDHPNLAFASEKNMNQGKGDVSQQETKKFQEGNCQGFVVYQHNLQISGKRQISDAHSVDFSIKGVCITCIEALPHINKKPKITITSGGPGSDSVSMNFDTNENNDYSVIIYGDFRECLTD